MVVQLEVTSNMRISACYLWLTPNAGESIPVRLFLSAFELTPTYKNVHNKFSVKYFLNLVLVDEEDRRYFKQQEYATTNIHYVSAIH